MIKKIRQLNSALPGLFLGICASGILFGMIFIWFVEEKGQFCLGLLLGVVMALLMAWHMAYTLDAAMNLGEEGAVKVMQKHYFLRYGAVVLLCGIVMVTEIANPLAVFLGIMTLKVAAYLEPFTHKFFYKERD
ncbi:MAG: ATP synthase subunit I [Roseburia sp.]|nr:ATP synthase subunit I [Roseburia sp.]MCM1279847.1 ATP synthase subunit I [Robinsoniella sp.]